MSDKWRVTAEMDDIEAEKLEVEDEVASEDEAMELCKNVAEEGFFYSQDEDKKTYYHPAMILSVTMERIKDELRE